MSHYCKNCGGTGKATCPRCGGTGTFNDGSTCYYCNGKGYYECNACNGTAKRGCFTWDTVKDVRTASTAETDTAMSMTRQ